MFAGYRERVWHREDGFAVEHWVDDSLDFPLVWDDSQRQPGQRHGVLNFFVGGDQVAPALTGNTAKVGRRFVAQLDKALPSRARRGEALVVAGGTVAAGFRPSPSCLANSKSPTFTRMIFCSWVMS